MMRAFLPLVFITLCVAITSQLHAQSRRDSVQVDTVKNKFLPTGIRFGADVISFVKSRTQNNFNGYEVNGEVDLNRYFVTVEYGMWERNFFHPDSASYANSGTYWRAGVDVNFLTKDPDRNVFFLGARYGRSVFAESMSVTTFDPVWGLLQDSFYHSNVKASWVELTAGLRVKIWKLLWFGYTGRFKFALNTDVTDEMIPHDVPGYGRNDRETTWGFNYYIMIRIPVRKAPPIPEKRN